MLFWRAKVILFKQLKFLDFPECSTTLSEGFKSLSISVSTLSFVLWVGGRRIASTSAQRSLQCARLLCVCSCYE